MTLANIVERTKCSREHALNVITVLIKHNLLSAQLSTFKNAHFYSFSQQECLMRLSFPRFVALTAKGESGSCRELVRVAIMREVFMAGSLLKTELA